VRQVEHAPPAGPRLQRETLAAIASAIEVVMADERHVDGLVCARRVRTSAVQGQTGNEQQRQAVPAHGATSIEEFASPFPKRGEQRRTG
jgi:hypothetical protein